MREVTRWVFLDDVSGTIFSRPPSIYLYWAKYNMTQNFELPISALQRISPSKMHQKFGQVWYKYKHGGKGVPRDLRKWMRVRKKWSRQTNKLWWTRIWKYTCSSFSFLLWHLYLWTDDRTSEHNELKTGSTTSGRCVCSTATATATDIETDQGWPRTRTRTRTPPSCSSPPSSGT